MSYIYEWRGGSLDSGHFYASKSAAMQITALYPRVEKLMLSLPFVV